MERKNSCKVLRTKTETLKRHNCFCEKKEPWKKEAAARSKKPARETSTTKCPIEPTKNVEEWANQQPPAHPCPY